MAIGLGGQRVEYGGLKANGLHRLIWTRIIRRYVLPEVGVALLEEVRHWRRVLWFQMLKQGSTSLFLPISYGSRCRTLNYLASTMSAYSHVWHHVDNGLNL